MKLPDFLVTKDIHIRPFREEYIDTNCKKFFPNSVLHQAILNVCTRSLLGINRRKSPAESPPEMLCQETVV